MYNEAILEDIKNKKNKAEIARKIYMGYPTSVFRGNENLEFEILNRISEFFSIPYNTIQIAGSAKTGRSYFKQTDFKLKESDLDIAIISDELFLFYMKVVYEETKGYTNQSNFPRDKNSGRSKYEQYIKNISKGNFRPDLMPRSKYKSDWFTFFNKLSGDYYEYFKDINAGIYLNQTFFEFKQMENIENFLESQGGI